MTANHVLVQAHRGYSGVYPENTMRSFAEAVALGVDILELDIHISSDGVVVVIHDDNLDRTTNGSGPVIGKTAAELKALDAGVWRGPEFAGERLPTLDEVLNRFSNQVQFNIEIKSVTSGYPYWYETLQPALASIDQRNLWSRCMFISFDVQALLAVLEYNQDAFTAFLDWRSGQERSKQKLLQKAGIKGWHPHPSVARRELVEDAHDLGLLVLCGAGKRLDNLEQEVETCLELGVDGISTNYPEHVITLLRERGRWKC